MDVTIKNKDKNNSNNNIETTVELASKIKKLFYNTGRVRYNFNK